MRQLNIFASTCFPLEFFKTFCPNRVLPSTSFSFNFWLINVTLYKPVNLKRYASLVHSFSRKLNCKIIFEPGRSIVGNAGILVSKVEYIKNGTNKKFVILNAGMNDFMRPALYDVQHDIIPIKKTSKKIKGVIEFVGPICESTCKFGKYKNYQKISENDFVAITNVGAYGASLSSNYNTRPLIAEILVNKNKFKFIRKKQNLLKLISA